MKMSSNLDEMLQEAPSLTLSPFAQTETAEDTVLSVVEEEPKVPEVVT